MEEGAEKKLEQLYEADQADRPNYMDWEVFFRDRKRREMVKNFLEQGMIKSAEGYYHAAMIFQHGEGTEDFKKANELAQKSMESGYEPAKWLYAASYDRLLRSRSEFQKYGTQFEVLGDGTWILQPYDDNTTDEERSRYNVPLLAKTLKLAQVNTQRARRGEKTIYFDQLD